MKCRENSASRDWVSFPRKRTNCSPVPSTRDKIKLYSRQSSRRARGRNIRWVFWHCHPSASRSCNKPKQREAIKNSVVLRKHTIYLSITRIYFSSSDFHVYTRSRSTLKKRSSVWWRVNNLFWLLRGIVYRGTPLFPFCDSPYEPLNFASSRIERRYECVRTFVQTRRDAAKSYAPALTFTTNIGCCDGEHRQMFPIVQEKKRERERERDSTLQISHKSATGPADFRRYLLRGFTRGWNSITEMWLPKSKSPSLLERDRHTAWYRSFLCYYQLYTLSGRIKRWSHWLGRWWLLFPITTLWQAKFLRNLYIRVRIIYSHESRFFRLNRAKNREELRGFGKKCKCS